MSALRPESRLLRRRLVAVSGGLVAVVLLLTSVALVTTQSRLLLESVDERLEQSAGRLRRTASAGLPIGDDDSFQQVVEDGDIIDGDPVGQSLDPLPAGPEAGARTLHFYDGDMRVLTVPTGDGTTVVVGLPLDDIDEGRRSLLTALAVALPLAIALLVGAIWWLVGRVLGRVDAAAARERQFVADAAHELRTPLTRLRTELEVDAVAPDPATTARVLDEVVGLQTLVDDLLYLARSDAGSTGGLDAEVDLTDLVHRLGGTAPDGIVVPGNAVLLRRAITNLLDNAHRHATTVTLTATQSPDAIEITVADDGPGIPATERDAVFERFHRLDEARDRRSGGAGLGLAISREIAERHGGTLTLVPTATGATFRVRLSPQT